MRSGRRDLLKLLLGAGVAMAAPPALADTSPPEKLIAAARTQIGVTLIYDPSYTRIDYPKGDIDRLYGVCADVIVRAYRDGLDLDLQELLHRDMKKNFAVYPSTWGLDRPDRNIDHRRVLNLETLLKRRDAQVWRNRGGVTDGAAFPEALISGDLLTWAQRQVASYRLRRRYRRRADGDPQYRLGRAGEFAGRSLAPSAGRALPVGGVMENLV